MYSSTFFGVLLVPASASDLLRYVFMSSLRFPSEDMGTQPPSQPTASVFRRAFYAITVVILVLIIGTIGFHYIEGASYIDAFYFESMLATGQGPPTAPPSDGAKIFTSIMAFVSVGSVVSTLLFAVGPVLRRFWREEAEYVEAGARHLEQEIERRL